MKWDEESMYFVKFWMQLSSSGHILYLVLCCFVAVWRHSPGVVWVWCSTWCFGVPFPNTVALVRIGYCVSSWWNRVSSTIARMVSMTQFATWPLAICVLRRRAGVGFEGPPTSCNNRIKCLSRWRGIRHLHHYEFSAKL